MFNLFSFQKQKTIQIPVHEVPLGLPKQVKSLCPECKKIITAEILEENGKVIMKKECKEHGPFIDIIYSDVNLYLRNERLTFEDAKGIQNPISEGKLCPMDCGLCSQHKSYSCLTNIDLTNRCNLKCPICFANANVKGYVYELNKKQIREMLINIIKQNQPQQTHNVQFSGGEPTIHPDFFYALKTAKELGFVQIQIATNGIKLADLDFLKKAKEAGLTAVYLQFDGFDREAYINTRGVDLREIKNKAIENCRKLDIGVCLVPTIVKTINDKEVGKIVRFALENADVIHGISFQPVAFTGRISTKERLKLRYTLSDLAYDVERQTGVALAYDFYPLSMSYPITKLFSYLLRKQTINITCHSNCGIGTYILVNIEDRSIKPMSVMNFLDFVPMMFEINNIMSKAKDTKFSRYITLKRVTHTMKKYFVEERAPPGFTVKDFIEGLLVEATLKDKRETPWRLVFVAGMHFQDTYNYNIDRVQRCVIHYSAPNGRIYPFCTYNTGPTFREEIEKQFSIPLDEYRAKNIGS